MIRQGEYAVVDGVEYKAVIMTDSLFLLLPQTVPCPDGWERAGGLQPTKSDHTINTITAHFDELQGLSGSNYTARVQELVEQDFRAEHPGDLSTAAVKELEARIDYSGRALEPANPHRGNGFGGSPATGHYTPELQLFDRLPLPDGAEVWKIAPNGERVPVARFHDGEWMVLS